ncbi:hypothetical protein [Halalkalicoccus subterraneus]|uniref:hypothetical protein n=1 Tax=Halalkalicoccus subterraneus TaxID=2675002 RepID=UPI0013CE483D|nr:hypothetical protein [Halalkalicoccus subterraneus]
MGSDKIESHDDWEVVRLPTLLIQISRDEEIAPREDLRRAVMNREYIAPETADMVIQSAIDDGIIERHNGEVLHLLEDGKVLFEDFDHDE